MLIDILSVRVWAMESGFFDRVHPVALNLISNGKDLSTLINQEKRADLYPTTGDFDRVSGLRYATSKKTNRRVAMFGVSGGLTKSGGLCAYGMRDYTKAIERANQSGNIDAIVMEMDTPGGSVDGTEEFGRAVKESKKPVIIFGDQMVASAGYWIASQADFIMANKYNDTDFGSIGVLYVHENWASFIEKEIGTIKIFRAPQSVDKALINPIEELTTELEAQISSELKTIATKFIKTVKSGRKGKLNTGDEDIFTGKMYSREDALRMGMIDGIGTREDAIEKAAELANGRISISGNSNNSNTNSKNMKWSKISSLFGGNAGEESEDLSPEEKAKLDAAEQKLADQEKQNGDLQEQVKTLNDKIADIDKAHTEAIKTKDAKIAELEGQVKDLNAKLEKAPDGPATTVVSEGDDFEDDPKQQSFETSVDKELKAHMESINGKAVNN